MKQNISQIAIALALVSTACGEPTFPAETGPDVDSSDALPSTTTPDDRDTPPRSESESDSDDDDSSMPTDPLDPDRGDSAGDGADSSAADDSGDGATDGEHRSDHGLPCDVKELLDEHCGMCHGSPPKFGAPMSLSSFDDLMAPAPSDPSRANYDVVMDRVKDADRIMPPVPNDPLDAGAIQVLQDWIDDGPTSDERGEVCEGGSSDPDDGDPAPLECDHVYELRANASGDGYSVPLEDDHYECFYFKAPNDANFARSFEPVIDDDRVLHHWLLYAEANAAFAEGTRETCSGIHPNAELLAGWAPGGQAHRLPENVGLKMPYGEDVYFILEIHYNNVARHTDAKDRSGVNICTSETELEHTAAVHWLGTENILLLPGEASAGSECKPTMQEPITVLSVTPHMHELGKHSNMVVNRSDGSQEVLLDEPFDFANQVGYDTPTVLMPGDSISSTCTWNNARGGIVGFGEGTSDEMCYLFTVAYPAGALNTGGDLLGVGAIGGENKCMK